MQREQLADLAAEAILMPALERLLPDYPDIKVEITVAYGLTNVVAERYDACTSGSG